VTAHKKVREKRKESSVPEKKKRKKDPYLKTIKGFF